MRAHDAPVFHGWFEHHAIGKAIRQLALDLLPRGLALGILIAATGLELRMALSKVSIRNQDVGRALVQIDAHPVSRFQHSEAAASGRFRRCIENGG